MPRNIFALLTDFGTADSYVAQMKGVLLSRCPDCTLVDITHQVPPQDVLLASQILAEVFPQFPAGTTHAVVVDPGVGTGRDIIAVELAGQRLVLPDNGLLTHLWHRFQPQRIHRVVNEQLWNQPTSSTFHGRDIIAPVAAFLALSEDWETVGPKADEVLLLLLTNEAQRISHHRWSCVIQSKDRFGNLLLSDSEELLESLRIVRIAELRWDEKRFLRVRFVQTYGDALPGEIILLCDSQNRLELAQVNGSVGRELNLHPQMSIEISLVSDE